jgi:uncharacterized protein (DUF1697 family)
VAGTTTYVALLRGVNLGRQRRVAMADLRALVEGLGHTGVRTLLQSGNVVLSGRSGTPERVARRLEEALAARYGFEVGVVVRTRDALAAVVAADPLGHLATDPARYAVVFCSAPVGDRLADLAPDTYAPDVVHVAESEVYVWMPDGFRGTRVPADLWDRRLPGTTTTTRNWRTVTRLLALADEPRA